MARPSSGMNLSIAQLNSIIASRRTELTRLRRRQRALQKELNDIDRRINRIEGSGGRGGNGRVRNERSLPDAIEHVMQRSGKPMRVSEIVTAVQSAGYRTSSDNFRSIVNQNLIKDKRFGAVERGVYQLKK